MKIGGGGILTAEQKHKRDFRGTSKWKNWRKYLKNKQKVDQITGKPLLKGFNCHHLDMRDEWYEDLHEDKFICLNKQTHEVLHWLFRYRNWRQVLYNLSDYLSKMEQYRED